MLKKEMNKLLSKEMSNIYVKVTIEKNWRSQNFGFLSLKIFLQASFWGAATHPDIIESEVWVQNCVWLFYYSSFEKNYDVLKSKSPCILLSKNINFDKNETESKMENPTPRFRETNPVLQLI